MSSRFHGLMFYGSLVSLIIVTIIIAYLAANQSNVIIQSLPKVLNVGVDYNIPENFLPFPNSPLDIVYAPTITCTITQSFYGTTDTNQQIPLSVMYASGVQPFKTFDITSGVSGTKFTTFNVRAQLYCPITASNYPPVLLSGNVKLYWTGTTNNGAVVNILSDSQPVTINPTDPSHPYRGQNIGGQAITLYTWSIPESQIESALGVQGGQQFTSEQNIAVTPNLVFTQGFTGAQSPSTQWTFNTGAPLISYKLYISSNSLLGGLSSNPNAPIDLVVTSPANAQLNVQSLQTVTLDAQISNWSATQGYPEIKLFYTDPTSLNQNIAIWDQVLIGYTPTTDASKVSHFTVQYPFSQSAQTGQYTFKLYQNGRINVASQNVQVSSNVLTCPQGQFPSTNPVTGASYCKSVTPTVTPPSGNQSNSCPTGQLCFPAGQFNLQTFLNALGSGLLPILSGVGATLSTIVSIVFVILIFIVLAYVGMHVYKKAKTGEGIIPSPPQVINNYE